MLNFLNAKLEVLGAQKFKIIAPLASLTSDVMLLIYILKMFRETLLTPKAFAPFLAMQGIRPSQLSQEDLMAIINLMENSLHAGLAILLFFHCIVYLFCIKNKHWAKKYVKGYASTAAFLSIFEVIGVLAFDGRVNILTLMTMIIYFLVYYGYRYFMKNGEL